MTIERMDQNRSNETAISLDKLPKTVLQAIYHTVTGKTENLTSKLIGNVVINSSDINRLYNMIIDQIDIYEKITDPTVTIVVEYANEKTSTYSSWQRFQALQTNNHDVTSEITLKFELILKLPGTTNPQRCIVNINLDSSLPMLNRKGSQQFPDGLDFILIFRREWQAVHVSIDFVDFLVAKSFVNTVEEWFNSLNKSPKKKFNDFLYSNYEILRKTLGQFGRIGMAVFLSAYAYFSKDGIFSLVSVINSVAIGLFLWSLFVIIETTVLKKALRRIASNIVPAVILLSDGDRKSFSEVTDSLNSAHLTIAIFTGTILLNVAVNIAASIIYSYFSK